MLAYPIVAQHVHAHGFLAKVHQCLISHSRRRRLPQQLNTILIFILIFKITKSFKINASIAFQTSHPAKPKEHCAECDDCPLFCLVEWTRVTIFPIAKTDAYQALSERLDAIRRRILTP